MSGANLGVGRCAIDAAGLTAGPCRIAGKVRQVKTSAATTTIPATVDS
jgi:hypothetical protein